MNKLINTDVLLNDKGQHLKEKSANKGLCLKEKSAREACTFSKQGLFFDKNGCGKLPQQ